MWEICNKFISQAMRSNIRRHSVNTSDALSAMPYVGHHCDDGPLDQFKYLSETLHATEIGVGHFGLSLALQEREQQSDFVLVFRRTKR